MDRTVDKTVVEYIEPEKKQHVNGLGLAGTILGGGALLGVAGNTLGNMVNRYFGGGNVIAPAMVPAAAQVIQSAIPPIVNTLNAVANEGGYVTKENLNLVREISTKDSEIAQLKAEKYADNAVKVATEKTEAKFERKIEKMDWETEKLKTEVCELQKVVAVNTESDKNYRHYADRIFVHQPKAYMRNRILTCEDPCCCCDDHKGHHHDNC